jgi:regulator of protease activity HflC (stomatin/prohibitin superfamily)
MGVYPLRREVFSGRNRSEEKMMLQEFGPSIFLVIMILIICGARVLRENERAVIFRMGLLLHIRGPGIIYVIPLIERMIRVNLDKQLPGWRGMLNDDLNQRVQKLVSKTSGEPLKQD